MGEEGRNSPVEAVRHGEKEQSEKQCGSGFDGNEEHSILDMLSLMWKANEIM